MRIRVWSIMVLAMLAGGCEKPAEPEAQQRAIEAGEAGPAAPISAAPLPSDTGTGAAEFADGEGAGRAVNVSNDLYEFAFAYPDAAGAIPGLRKVLEQRLDDARAQLAASARQDQKVAEQDGFPYRAHAFGASWKVVASLPQWLSLSAELYEYTGGAHGMSNFDTLLWDRRTETVREPTDLFTSKAALSAAMRTRFCAALDRQRAKRRENPITLDGDAMFSDCIDPVAETVILGSSNGKTFDRIGVLIAPYSAGPYAEGSYEVTLPVDGAVMKALRPQYRSSFSIP